MITTNINNLTAGAMPFDMFFDKPAQVGSFGNNIPALQHQSAEVIYYFRAAHLHNAGSNKFKAGIAAARKRINFAKPMAIELDRMLSNY